MKRALILFGIFLAVISCGPRAVQKAPPPKQEKGPVLPEAWVIREEVNIRQSGTTKSEIVHTLNDGDKVYIEENRNGWYRIRFGENRNGWVRSDLVGPRNLSRTILARAFVDSILPAYKSEMYFDTKELYSVIYLVLPGPDYSSKARAAQKAQKIGEAYQRNVYPGDLEVRIMKADEQSELFMKIQLEAIAMADIPLPVLKHGILHKLESPSYGEVRLWILVPEKLNNETGLQMARSVSANYAYPFTKAEIYLVANTAEGLDYLSAPQKENPAEGVLKLFYLEDKNGEYYEFDISGQIPSPYQ